MNCLLDIAGEGNRNGIIIDGKGIRGEIIVADGIEEFKEQYPSLESYWRSIILFGRNVASYKFALAKSLLEIAPTGKKSLRLKN